MRAITDTRKHRSYGTYRTTDEVVGFLMDYLHYSICDDIEAAGFLMDYLHYSICDDNKDNPLTLLRDAVDLLSDAVSVMRMDYRYPESCIDTTRSILIKASPFSLKRIIDLSINNVHQIIQDLPFSCFKNNNEIIGNIDLALVCLERSRYCYTS